MSEILRDLRWLTTTPGLFGPVGTMAIVVGLLPPSVLPIPWWARLLIGVAGVVMVVLTARAAWRRVLSENRSGKR